MKKDPTRNTRAARYRAATKETGGAQINVRVGPEAAAVLAGMRASGMTVREAIESALLDQRARRPEVFWGGVTSAIDDALARLKVNPPAPAAPQASTSAPAD